MAKYNYEFKRKIVNAYLNGNGENGRRACTSVHLMKENTLTIFLSIL